MPSRRSASAGPSTSTPRLSGSSGQRPAPAPRTHGDGWFPLPPHPAIPSPAPRATICGRPGVPGFSRPSMSSRKSCPAIPDIAHRAARADRGGAGRAGREPLLNTSTPHEPGPADKFVRGENRPHRCAPADRLPGACRSSCRGRWPRNRARGWRHGCAGGARGGAHQFFSPVTLEAAEKGANAHTVLPARIGEAGFQDGQNQSRHRLQGPRARRFQSFPARSARWSDARKGR